MRLRRSTIENQTNYRQLSGYSKRGRRAPNANHAKGLEGQVHDQTQYNGEQTHHQEDNLGGISVNHSVRDRNDLSRLDNFLQNLSISTPLADKSFTSSRRRPTYHQLLDHEPIEHNDHYADGTADGFLPVLGLDLDLSVPGYPLNFELPESSTHLVYEDSVPSYFAVPTPIPIDDLIAPSFVGPPRPTPAPLAVKPAYRKRQPGATNHLPRPPADFLDDGRSALESGQWIGNFDVEAGADSHQRVDDNGPEISPRPVRPAAAKPLRQILIDELTHQGDALSQLRAVLQTQLSRLQIEEGMLMAMLEIKTKNVVVSPRPFLVPQADGVGEAPAVPQAVPQVAVESHQRRVADGGKSGTVVEQMAVNVEAVNVEAVNVEAVNVEAVNEEMADGVVVVPVQEVVLSKGDELEKKGYASDDDDDDDDDDDEDEDDDEYAELAKVDDEDEMARRALGIMLEQYDNE